MTFDEAQKRLLEEVGAGRDDLTEDARQAIVAVWPLLPSLIEEKLGTADARIFSREALRGLLAEFAVAVLCEQAQTIVRVRDARVRARRRRRKGA